MDVRHTDGRSVRNVTGNDKHVGEVIAVGTKEGGYVQVYDDYLKETITYMHIGTPNFKPIYVKWFDEENIAVIMNNFTLETTSPDVIEKIYAYNLKNKHYALIFEGKFLGNNWDMKFKKLLNGNFLLEGNNMALEIEKQSFKLKKIIPYPEGSYEGDSSYSQTQIAYSKEEGLYLHTIGSPSSEDTELCKYDDSKKIRPTMPLWSYDDKILSYLLLHIENENQNEFVFVDPITKKQKSYIFGEATTLGWWFQDNIRFVACSAGESFGLVPIIKVINISNDQVQDFNTTGEIEIECPPHGDQILYVQTDTESKSGYYPERIVNFNVVTNTSDIVTPDFLNIASSNFSPSGNQVLFIANSNPGEELSLYVAQKKTK
ncbi:MAG: hypothetical protein PWQ97_417 [Tepidanaerobacteraceae bacterium]|nr:hypothetical protein [Tepidanaerobacteraceae bacterium]